MQQCATCNTWHWPAVSRCAECGSWDPAWRDVAIEGDIFSWAVTQHNFGAPESIKVPYTTVLVELSGAGGRRLLGLWDGNADQLRAGLRVSGAFGSTIVRGKPIPSLRWRPASIA